MYNAETIRHLIKLIEMNDGKTTKTALTKIVQDHFSLTKNRSVYYCKDFAIRFCTVNSQSFGNTILSLSTLQKYDHIPFIVCLVTPSNNRMLLANTTFLRKISHSSQALSINNIVGSFNGQDILQKFEGVENQPKNFEFLFKLHCNHSFEENLIRLVKTTNNIETTRPKFIPTKKQKDMILQSVKRADAFMSSNNYKNLKEDLDSRIIKAEKEIMLATSINNVNIRGRTIEYLITSANKANSNPISKLYTANGLGDYSYSFKEFKTETDIKSKMPFYQATQNDTISISYFLFWELKKVYILFLLLVLMNYPN